MELVQVQTLEDGVDLLMCFRDECTWFHQNARSFVVEQQFFSCRILLFGVRSGPQVLCRVVVWVMRSTRGWETAGQTNGSVDDPIIALCGTSLRRRILAMSALLCGVPHGSTWLTRRDPWGRKLCWLEPISL